jgi:hypothetical protein
MEMEKKMQKRRINKHVCDKDQLNLLNTKIDDQEENSTKKELTRRRKKTNQSMSQVHIQEKVTTYTTNLFKIASIVIAYARSNTIRKLLSKRNLT